MQQFELQDAGQPNQLFMMHASMLAKAAMMVIAKALLNLFALTIGIHVLNKGMSGIMSNTFMQEDIQSCKQES